MIRNGMFVSALAASAVLVASPVQASMNFGAISGIINQLRDNSSFSNNDFSFAINNGGRSQHLFTGVTGLRQFSDLAGFNSWANPNGSNWSGNSNGYNFTYSVLPSYFGNQSSGNSSSSSSGYTFTYTVLPTYFGHQTGQSADSQPVPAAMSQGAIPEPGTWAMMLLGFGLIGLAMRRHRPASQTLA